MHSWNYSMPNVVHFTTFETPLGAMRAVADEKALHALVFVDEQASDWIDEGVLVLTEPLRLIQVELKDYFAGRLKNFKTPHVMQGTAFQTAAWGALKKIPYGQTKSYAELARAIAKPLACRAIGNANGANPLAIVVPCHRVINSNGGLGGYSAGLWRKEWLLNHEKNDE